MKYTAVYKAIREETYGVYEINANSAEEAKEIFRDILYRDHVDYSDEKTISTSIEVKEKE